MFFRLGNQEGAIPESAPVDGHSFDKSNWLARILLPMAAFIAAGFFIAVLEMMRLALVGFGADAITDFGVGWYLSGVFFTSILAALVNHLPIVVGFAATVSRPCGRRGLGLVAAVVFAVFWHATVM